MIMAATGFDRKFQNVTHVIFDMDGLLLDSEKGYDKVMESMAAKYGKTYTLDAKLKILGTPEPMTAKLAVEEMGLPVTPTEFLEEYRKLVQLELKHPALMPGAERLVRHFHKHNVPIAVATSSSDSSVELKTQDYKELFSLFHHIVRGTTDPEVKNGKPAPDIFLVCASRFPDKPKPEKCLVFEDAPNGITGAVAAGMQAVMVPAKDVMPELRKNATLVLESLTEFKPEWFGLPPFEEKLVNGCTCD